MGRGVGHVSDSVIRLIQQWATDLRNTWILSTEDTFRD